MSAFIENEEHPEFSSVFFYKVFRHMEESYSVKDILEEFNYAQSPRVEHIIQQLKDISEDEKWSRYRNRLQDIYDRNPGIPSRSILRCYAFQIYLYTRDSFDYSC